jgi:hypothetical protein
MDAAVAGRAEGDCQQINCRTIEQPASDSVSMRVTSGIISAGRAKVNGCAWLQSLQSADRPALQAAARPVEFVSRLCGRSVAGSRWRAARVDARRLASVLTDFVPMAEKRLRLFPMTPIGKIAKARLRERASEKAKPWSRP